MGGPRRFSGFYSPVVRSFLRKRGDPDYRKPSVDIQLLVLVARDRNPVFSLSLSLSRRNLPPSASLDTFYFSRSHKRGYTGIAPIFFIIAFYSMFYREFTFRRSLMDSHGATLTPVSISAISRRASRAKWIFSMTFRMQNHNVEI